MTLEDIIKMARDFGLKGRTFEDFAEDDAICKAFVTLDEEHVFDRSTTAKIKEAFDSGRAEFRLVGGWPVAWTTASISYDHFGTMSVESAEWHNKTLRKVVMDPAHAYNQTSRYLSGAQVWDEDPRIIEAQIQERIARDRAEDEERAKRRSEGLVWILTADIAYTDEDIFDEELRQHGLQWTDVRIEEERRREAKERAAREVEWARCRATFADGVTIVDPGCEARSTLNGLVPNRKPAVYRCVRVVPHYTYVDDVDEATVEDEANRLVRSLRRVADRLLAGDCHVAVEGEDLPPEAVLERLKPSRFDDVVHVVVDDREVWVGCEGYSFQPIVLDERGHLVRAKKTKLIAERAFMARRYNS